MIPQSSADIGRYARTVKDVDNMGVILRRRRDDMTRVSLTPDQIRAIARTDPTYRIIPAGTVVRIVNYREPAYSFSGDSRATGLGFYRVRIEPDHDGTLALETVACNLELVDTPSTPCADLGVWATRMATGSIPYATYRADVDKQRARELAAAHARISDAYTKLSNALDNLAYVEGKK